MQADGRGWLYAPAGVAEGPMPTHYEPQDSPVHNRLRTQQRNPARLLYEHEHNRYHPDPGQAGAEVFPFVATTYRLTEHFTAGGMSRWLPYLSELQPDWGPNGYSRGDSMNELSAMSLDPSSHIQEVKALTLDIRPGRRPRGSARQELVKDYQRRAGITAQTGMAP